MLGFEKNTLKIFDNFKTDLDLPKYSVDLKKDKNDYTVISVNENDPNNNVTWTTDNSDNDIFIGGMDVGENDEKNEKFLFVWKIINWFISFFKRKSEKKKIIKTYNNIFEFFNDFDHKLKTITFRKDVSNHYERALKQAIDLHQTALVEKLKKLIEVYKFEIILYENNLRKYLTEEQIVTFYTKYADKDKALKLTWIKNFTRVIPEDIYKLKKDVDNLNIFDNYVILHYDPKNNGEEETEIEKELKRDPILFGVIKDSRKLYYIADWKDEYCNLTLDVLLTEMGDKPFKIDKKSIKTFIDKAEV